MQGLKDKVFIVTGGGSGIGAATVSRLLERHSVARSKSDQVDAMTLANILCVDAHLHRRLPADSELSQAIAVLARTDQDATWRRFKAHNELRSMLREFFPTFPAIAPTQPPAPN